MRTTETAMPEYRFLSKEEEQQFARQARAGDQAARERLIESQLAWVRKLVKRWCRSPQVYIDFDDLLSVAYLALVRAIDGFNPDRGFRLTTYVAAVVRQEIVKELKRQQKPHGHSRRSDVTTDDPLQAAIDAEERELLAAAINQLPERWQLIVRRKLKGHTLKAIGESLPEPICRERVRQLYHRSLARIEILLTKRPAIPDETQRSA